MTMRTLYQFPLSHYCEKARWLLDFKELDYVAKNLTPVLHYYKIKKNTKQHSLPVLREGRTWVNDSTKIALYLDMKYPEHPLVLKKLEHCEQILRIDRLSQRLGRHVRRWMFFYILQQKESPALKIMLGEKGKLKEWEDFSTPALKLLLKTSLKINDESASKSKIRIDTMLAQLEQILIANGGQYLVANQLTLADIAVCSMLAPLLMIQGTPWEKQSFVEYPQPLIAFQQLLKNRVLGQYVERIYQQERHARVDWRGV